MVDVKNRLYGLMKLAGRERVHISLKGLVVLLAGVAVSIGVMDASVAWGMFCLAFLVAVAMTLAWWRESGIVERLYNELARLRKEL